MNKRILWAALRIIISVVVVAAVITQLQHGIETNPNFNIANFFSFFTIQSNVVGALVMFISAFYLLANKWSPGLDSFRGAATLYMVITGVTYFLLLRGIEDQLQTPIPWVNIALHYAFPILILLDWLLSPLARKVLFSQTVAWLLFPIAYVVYSMIRGYYAFWYPYPFLNPLDGGYGKVIVMCMFISLIALAGAFLLTRNRNTVKRKPA